VPGCAGRGGCADRAECGKSDCRRNCSALMLLLIVTLRFLAPRL
jgi:hypothetical protein